MLDGWQTIEVDGKLCDVFDPDPAPKFGLLFLHGASGTTLVNNQVWTSLVQQFGLATVCPHGKRSWWSSKICREFDPRYGAESFVLNQVIDLFRDRWQLERPNLAITGVSMGGQGALRMAMKCPGQFPVAAALAAAIEHQCLHGTGTPLDEMYEDSEAIRQDTATLHVHPLNWPRQLFFAVDPEDTTWCDGNYKLHEKLQALGIRHEVDFETSHGGHSWEYMNHMAEKCLRFLSDGLEAEQRHIPMWTD